MSKTITYKETQAYPKTVGKKYLFCKEGKLFKLSFFLTAEQLEEMKELIGEIQSKEKSQL